MQAGQSEGSDTNLTSRDHAVETRHLTSATIVKHGRTMIRVGDTVRVRAAEGKRGGFDARVRGIKVDSTTGEVAEVQVFGGRLGRAMVRTFRPDRIEQPARGRKGGRR